MADTPGPALTLQRITTVCLVLVTTVVVVMALKLGQSLLAPIVFGLVIGVVMAPPVRKLNKVGIPNIVSAVVAMTLALVFIVGVVIFLGPLVARMAVVIPEIQREIQSHLQTFSRMLQGLDIIDHATGTSIESSGDTAVNEALPSIFSALWLAPNILAQFLMFMGTLFFFILTRDEIYQKFPSTKRMHRADRAVSHYFVAITFINAGLGVAVWLLLSAIGLPGAPIWGIVAALLNFVLYLGPAVMVTSLTVAGVVHFNGAAIFLPPVMYLCANLVEAQFVTPTVVGKRMQINPLGVFIAILFGIWLWGPIGGIVALPILVWVSAFLFSEPPESLPEEISKAVSDTGDAAAAPAE